MSSWPDTNRLKTFGTYTIPASEWDSRGNLLWIPAYGGQGEKRFRFSPEDRLLETAASGSTWRYAYDASGERVVSWLIDGTGGVTEARVAIRDESGAVLTDWLLTPDMFSRERDYMYAGGRMIAQIDWPGVPTRRFAATDHLGSTRFTIGLGENGYVVQGSGKAYEYYPFGRFKVGGADATTTHLFTGHERDLGANSSELDYMHARYYSPNLGRFMSVDPIGGTVGSSQSWNRYSYVLNNPIGLTDPDGRNPLGIAWVVERVLVGAVVGAATDVGYAALKRAVLTDQSFDEAVKEVAPSAGPRGAIKGAANVIPFGGAVAGGAIEFVDQKAAGQPTGEAAGRATVRFLGGVAGEIAGLATEPGKVPLNTTETVGTILVGNIVSDAIYGLGVDLPEAVEPPEGSSDQLKDKQDQEEQLEDEGEI